MVRHTFGVCIGGGGGLVVLVYPHKHHTLHTSEFSRYPKSRATICLARLGHVLICHMPHIPMWHTLPHTGLVVPDSFRCVLLSLICISLKIMVHFIFYVPLHTFCNYTYSAITHILDYTHSATVHTLSLTFGVHERVWPSVSHTVWLSHVNICECLHQTDNDLVVRH